MDPNLITTVMGLIGGGGSGGSEGGSGGFDLGSLLEIAKVIYWEVLTTVWVQLNLWSKFVRRTLDICFSNNFSLIQLKRGYPKKLPMVKKITRSPIQLKTCNLEPFCFLKKLCVNEKRPRKKLKFPKAWNMCIILSLVPSKTPVTRENWNKLLKYLLFNFWMIQLTKTPILPICQVPNGFFWYM